MSEVGNTDYLKTTLWLVSPSSAGSRLLDTYYS